MRTMLKTSLSHVPSMVFASFVGRTTTLSLLVSFPRFLINPHKGLFVWLVSRQGALTICNTSAVEALCQFSTCCKWIMPLLGHPFLSSIPDPTFYLLSSAKQANWILIYLMNLLQRHAEGTGYFETIMFHYVINNFIFFIVFLENLPLPWDH
jgi:hypothetical protein